MAKSPEQMKAAMIAGMAEVLGGKRDYFLFDSFAGLPPAREELDGAAAAAWHRDQTKRG